MQNNNDFAKPVSPWSRPGFVLSAGFVAVLAVAAAVIGLWPSDDPGPGGTPAPPSTSAETSALPTAIPSAPPGDVTWQPVGHGRVPVSRSAGPARVQDGTASGFAHSPEGALIAAAQLNVRAAFSSGRASWEPTIENQFLPGVDRDRLLTAMRSVSEQAGESGEVSPISGYIYQSYSPDTAVIALVYRAEISGSTVYQVVTNTLRWSNGDWRMVAPPGGSWTSVSRPATDLAGVVTWGSP